ncbi:MAG: hypothetical protein GW906_06525 [Epsilonproteobacteria bacterium]|nr:hypothetical protein [Campylobacterota bacterium]PIP10611.1 MAG: hypothetical protein COX50_04675 [Sulfurimonas sp. CG23_combo_of_CG06-09_8_20_14_all_36_33]PIS25584.1 MAG: hypothetical protein COT46_05355 [Sulfurimonas sp. CG08_land_8_20_14_0_20_36_33]PIU34890.1 MAG: hypothetical protein COT05_05555 [Sulfurimonas sp. CG07_land_8_20_14_0_80_36_56]PIV04604.1 MAG: hypothetical protein COS56_04175 [Sulfurimonas sp. CG03_land_8_20_14_0_80_36_25]PIV36457.1 MAG: hypothetical protein COS32_02855 [S
MSLELVESISVFSKWSRVYFQMQKLKIKHLKILSNELKDNSPDKTLVQYTFYGLTKISLDYENIKVLWNQNNSLEIINLMKKFSSIVLYENGTLKYIRPNQKKTNRVSTKLWNIVKYFFYIAIILLVILCIYTFSFEQLIIILTSILYLSMMHKYRDDFNKLDKLIDTQAHAKAHSLK